MKCKYQLIVVLGLLILMGFGFTTAVWAVTLEISKNSAELTAGDWLEFNTVLRNNGSTATPELVAHLNIAALNKGRYVDPEDWSLERTQYVPPIQPHESLKLKWKVHALIEGNFATFVTIVSANKSPNKLLDKSFSAMVTTPLIIQVAPDNILPMNEVIPVVALVPIFPLILLIFTTISSRRRSC